MTLIESRPAATTDFAMVALDLYKDIHKGIRAELFGVTGQAGSLDPSDRAARVAVADRVHATVELLLSHAEHEDGAIQPTLESQLPDLAERIATDHHSLDIRMVDLEALAADAVEATTATDQRTRSHRLYLELASFTGDYLAHQDIEERVVMPQLEAAVGIEAVVGMHQAILGSIPPDEMAHSLALMLPAMNVDDRTELLGGMREGAPAEVFEGVWGLAGTVLDPADHAAVAARLGIA